MPGGAMLDREDLVDDDVDRDAPPLRIVRGGELSEPVELPDDKAHGRRTLLWILTLVVAALFLIFFAGNP